MDIYRQFPGPNAAYVIELYERYRQDPDSVDAATRQAFARGAPPAEAVDHAAPAAAVPGKAGPGLAAEKIAGVVNLARAIRSHGHLAARLDPLGSPPPGDPSLDPAAHGLTEEDLRRLPAALVGGPAAAGAADALEAVRALRSIYSSHIGYDWAHLGVHEEREWLREAAEAGRFRPPHSPIEPIALLERLTRVEAFEQFLQRVFPGRTRFSIEGLDMMVPMLDDIIGEAADANICKIFLGMAHRGRLNVLAHVLNKPYSQLLAEFRDPLGGHNIAIRDDLGWTGDVKYHKGALRAVQNGEPIELVVNMPPNPSHLEQVDPVVEGMARAAATAVERGGPPNAYDCASLPILIHGDAAFSGQGVVAETMNLSRLEGYTAFGTIHIISNNQLGFTTPPEQERGTYYASDVAKGFNIPIVHVNADDPEACLEATRLAFAYRQKFQKDFLIDLIGYRRYGHNEGDEPGFTQPAMYQQIAAQPSVRALWAQTLVERGQVPPERPAELLRQRLDELQRILESLEPEEELIEPQLQPPPRGAAARAHTAVPAGELRGLNAALERLPEGFSLGSRLQRIVQRRRRSLDRDDEPAIDWGTAEELALASILAGGVPIRLTGQDAERGTFNQRLAVYHDADTGATYVPLQALPQSRAAFAIYNSPLSESAAVGFEYGYNIQAPERLVIWEAQYGDFINGAQIMVDEFIASGRAKWEQTPSLVLLLPHGYEGQGPDHSSGRLERFLASAAEINMRVAVPTTAAQYFHLLRRQAALLRTDPIPLVVMTPKSLLRHRTAMSSLRELAEGAWQPVIDDPLAREHARDVTRLVLCSGKVYVDLVSSKRRAENTCVAIARVEQLYLFPADALREVVDGYPGLREIVWVQEEPENMGAWRFLQPQLQELAAGRWPVHYIGRPPSSSPAEGSSAMHAVNQEALVEQAYNLEANVVQRDIVWLKRA